MNADQTAPLFARLLADVMIPAEFSAAIRARGYDIAEARELPPEMQQDDWAILAQAALQQLHLIPAATNEADISKPQRHSRSSDFSRLG